ncbi:hypothetical protein T492DRAFT_1016792 [Pavlovales sp. CCMP2436]|nr:hypothetical protein T492DRAFT_1016792 [Pavlovales sp. CCMP2436]
MENAVQYMHDKLVCAHIALYVNSLTSLSKADKARFIADIKGEAARMLAACGVENAMSKGADGTLNKPCFQGCEVKALLCSRAFYNYIAYVPTAARASAARASTPPSRPQVVAGSRVASHYANFDNKPDSEEEDVLSPESVAEAAARWELDIAAVTGAMQQILLVLRAFDLLSQYFEHITSTDYNDALAEARKAHADAAEQLARDFPVARLRATRADVPMCSSYDAIAVHTVSKNIRDHGHLLVFAREDGIEKKNQEAKTVSKPAVCRIRHFTSYVRKGKLVEFNRTWALQLAEALAVREVSVFRAAAYVADYVQSYQG